MKPIQHIKIVGIALLLALSAPTTSYEQTHTPEQQQLLDDMIAFEKAQNALARGDRKEMARLMMPLAARGNTQAIETLKLLGITDFSPPPEPKPIKKVPQISNVQKVKNDLKTCFDNPTKESLDASITACEATHSHFRIAGIKEDNKIKTMTSNQRTVTSYKVHDDYAYKSGIAAFQLTKLHNVKTPEDKANCVLIFIKPCGNSRTLKRNLRRAVSLGKQSRQSTIY